LSFYQFQELELTTCLNYVFYFSVWADADTWFERQQQEEEMQRLQAEHQAVVRAAEAEERKKLTEEREGEVEELEEKGDPMAKAEAEVLAQNNTGS
jgi:peptidyl-prolyl isomerase E (cyclophilin E)